LRLVNNLYTYIWQGSDNNCNSYVFADVLKGNRHVVIDPGHITTPSYHEPGLTWLFNEMGKDGIEGEKIGLVILTHAHPDHCEAASVIREQNSALVALHEVDGNIYKGPGGTIDIYLQEGELHLANSSQTTLQIYNSPGHSPGHQSVFIKMAERNYVYCGDAAPLHENLEERNIPGVLYRADQALKSIDMLRSIENAVYIYSHDNEQLTLI